MFAKLIKEYIIKYCDEKNYEYNAEDKDDRFFLIISNFKERINVTIYFTGSIVIGGKKTNLRLEFEEIKIIIDSDPKIVSNQEEIISKACTNKYNILNTEKRELVKNTLLEMSDIEKDFLDKPTPSEEYRLKLSTPNSSATLTQYNNGTLLLQGKQDIFFNSTCDLIEKTFNPDAKDVTTRYLAGCEAALNQFVKIYTPEVTILAENLVKEVLGEAYDFLELHDQKWLVASEILKIVNVPLPEFTPIVMPASKAFEGFIKKLSIDLGLCTAEHFDVKQANFSFLKDKNNPLRKIVVQKEKYAETYLDMINLCLDTNRNFMLHSDKSAVTKIETYDNAVKKLGDIYKDIIVIHKYFKTPVFGLP